MCARQSLLLPIKLRVSNAERTVRYNLRQRAHCSQLSVPTVSTRLSAFPIFVAFAAWNVLDLDAVSLDLNSFQLHLKYVGLYSRIVQRLMQNGREKFYYSIEAL